MVVALFDKLENMYFFPYLPGKAYHDENTNVSGVCHWLGRFSFKSVKAPCRQSCTADLAMMWLLMNENRSAEKIRREASSKMSLVASLLEKIFRLM